MKEKRINKQTILIILLVLSLMINVLFLWMILNDSDSSDTNQQAHIQNCNAFAEGYENVTGEYIEHRIRLGGITLLRDAETKINFSNNAQTQTENTPEPVLNEAISSQENTAGQ